MKRIILPIFLIFLPFCFVSCKTGETKQTETVTRAKPTVESKVNAPYDYVTTTDMETQQKKPFTIMIYMNGSDLEREYKSATADIKEMARSGFNENNVNVIIYTGGSKKWHMSEIPDKTNAIFQLTKMGSTTGVRPKLLTNAGNTSMGDWRTLGGFIKFCQYFYPADKFGLILWNHGGGAVVGYGYDEKFENTPELVAMKLSDIGRGLSCLNGQKLEFIGFDTCLLATLELAGVCANHAKYLIASEEVEPENGWDYMFLGNITKNSDGLSIGNNIINCFENFYQHIKYEDFITLSLTDLSKIGNLNAAFEDFALTAAQDLSNGGFDAISRARANGRMFGSGGEDGETDMVDLLDLTDYMADLFPAESYALIDALASAVVRKNPSANWLGGLSVYFPFANKQNLDYNLSVYGETNTLPEYTAFLRDFCDVLTADFDYTFVTRGKVNTANSDNISKIDNISDISLTLWDKITIDKTEQLIQIAEGGSVILEEDGTITIEEEPALTYISTDGGTVAACLYASKNADPTSKRRYTVPITLNGQDANLIIIIPENGAFGGKIIGAIPTNNDVYNMIDKKLVKLSNTDKIRVRYYTLPVNAEKDKKQDETWTLSSEFSATNISLIKHTQENLIKKLKVTDTKNDSFYTDID